MYKRQVQRCLSTVGEILQAGWALASNNERPTREHRQSYSAPRSSSTRLLEGAVGHDDKVTDDNNDDDDDDEINN